MEYYNKRVEDIYEEFSSSYDGLKKKDALKRLGDYGKNIIEERKRTSSLKKFLREFNDLMIIILIIVAILMGVYAFFYSGNYTDTIVIIVVIFLNAFMGFIQERKAEVTLESLKKYTNTICKVKRNGKVDLINSEGIVPGDIILLESGDIVPADARIINEVNLKTDESSLTGESLPVKKMSKRLRGKRRLQEQVNMIFSGCSIVNGSCEAIVIKTGSKTELGQIAVSLNTPYEVETPLEIKIKDISRKITFLVFIAVIFIFLYGVFKEYKTLEIVMLCISLAVAAIPEGSPAVITIALSSGAFSLAKKKTIVRQMSAIETLGSVDVICSDKTGTITQNKMEVKALLIHNNKMFKYIASLANETIIDNHEYFGDPTETCLYDFLSSRKINPIKIREECPRLIEAPFDSERKMMSSINTIKGKNYMLVKGSLETLLPKCKYINKNGKVTLLNLKMKNKILNNEQELSKSALRVIAFAYKEVKRVPETIPSLIKRENNLIYVGMAGIIDPPREGVKLSVKKCKKAGIRPIMITGDSLTTACAVAREVGIIKSESEAILGEELDKCSDKELEGIVKKYNVYARVSPLHKTKIVACLQKMGKVVAMTGDGVNDAPAIKDAHVGVGMGRSAQSVTKSVADIIILDDSFSTIVVAVEEGRRIFSNIRNNLVYSLSSNFAELFTVLIGMFTGHTILLPIHILFIDLITDTIPSICLSFEKSEEHIMKSSPRGINKPIFTPFIKASVIYSAIIETIFALLTYFAALKYYTEEIATSLALFSIAIQEITYAISCRNLKTPIYKHGIFSNKSMNFGILIVVVIELIIFLTPIGKILSIETLSLSLIFKVFVINLMGIFFYEIAKPILKMAFKD